MNDIINRKVNGYEISKYFKNCSLPDITSNDGRLLAINDKFLVMPWKYPGQINIVNSENPIDLSSNNNQIFNYGNSTILDMEFSPFNSNVLAISNENNSVILSNIKEGNKIKLNSNFYYHGNKIRKVVFINFNPIASNIMCSCTTSHELHIFDSLQLKQISRFNVENYPNSISWNPNGSLVGISTKTGLFQCIDPRKRELIFNNKINDFSQNLKFAWIDNNNIASIGWNNRGVKYLKIIDIRNFNNNYLTSITIDRSSNQTIPYVNPELKLIYSVAKEEKNIKIFDYSQGKLQNNEDYLCSEYNFFSVPLSRKYLDKEKLELDRFIRLTKKKNIY